MSKPEHNTADRRQENSFAESKSDDSSPGEDAMELNSQQDSQRTEDTLIIDSDSQETVVEEYKAPSPRLERTYAIGPGHKAPPKTEQFARTKTNNLYK